MRTLMLVLVGAASLLAIEPRPSDNQEGFHYTYNFQPGGKLTVENFNGSIEISGWDQNTVDVTGTKKDVKVEVTVSGDTVDVRTVGGGGANLVIKVPRRTELVRIVTSNGGIRVNDVEGGGVLATSNGGVRVTNVRGKLDVRTSNGGVEVSDSNGPVAVHTSNGAITAERVDGGLEARTSNGAITVRLPVSICARVRAVVSLHGSISTDFEIHKEIGGGKTRLEGVIGAGGPLIDLVTSNGSIRLGKL